MISARVEENGRIKVLQTTVSDSVLFEKIGFDFPKSWNGYTKTAVFRNGETTVSVVLDKSSELCTGENECYIPYEVIKAPQFTVSVFGVSGESRATTQQASIKVTESGYGTGDTPSEPTPSQYEQLVSIANATKQVVQSVRTDADNGVFKGDKGEKGDKGDKGDPFVYSDFTDEQLALLKGAKGDTGDTGPRGLQGKKGDTGAQGIQGAKGDKGNKGDKGDRGPAFTYEDFTSEQLAALKGEKGNPAETDQTYDPESENAQSGRAVAQAVSPLRQVIIIDTPVWETQPSITGVLDSSFKLWNESIYYVTLKNTDGTALPSGQFKLCASLNGYADAIDQIFTLDSENITENKVVDFKTISSDRISFEMRDAGVNTVRIDTKNFKSQRYVFTVFHSVLSKTVSATRYVFLKNDFEVNNGGKVTTYSPIGTYNGYSGFLFTAASSGSAPVFKMGYTVTVNRTSNGLVGNMNGLTESRTSITQNVFSDTTKATGDLTNENIKYFAFGEGAGNLSALAFANGTSIILEEF